VNITVQEVLSVSTGTSPSTTYQLFHDTDRSTTGNTLTSSLVSTSVTTGDLATIVNGTIPQNSWIWIKITSVSGTSVIFSVDIRYIVN
jgi:hypothetical protein